MTNDESKFVLFLGFGMGAALMCAFDPSGNIPALQGGREAEH